MIRPSYLAVISIVALLLLVPTAVAQQQQGEEEITQDEQEDVVVSIRDDSFDPVDAIVAPGTTVWWVNEGENKHSVTADNGLFDSGVVKPGEYYWVTFDGQGRITYHGSPEEMTGSVTVGERGDEEAEPAIQQQSPDRQQSPRQERQTPERESDVQQQSPHQEQSTSGGEPAIEHQTARQERTVTG